MNAGASNSASMTVDDAARARIRETPFAADVFGQRARRAGMAAVEREKVQAKKRKAGSSHYCPPPDAKCLPFWNPAVDVIPQG